MAAALLLLAPQTPLIFMGQEYDEPAPFQFFTDYGDPALQTAVREGRRKEFKKFRWEGMPDPQAPETFERSQPHWNLAGEDNPTLRWYRELIALRKRYLSAGDRTGRAQLHDGNLELQVPRDRPRIMVIAGFPGHAPSTPAPEWKEVLANQGEGYSVRVFVAANAGC
jgi:maltooligosyltrehalose trehalohydrolase